MHKSEQCLHQSRQGLLVLTGHDRLVANIIGDVREIEGASPLVRLLEQRRNALDKNLREGTQVELRGLDQFREPECATSAKLPTCGPACTRAARASPS